MIELLTVIFLVLFLAGIALPDFIQWLGSLRYKEASWDILSQLRLARQLAVTNNLEHRVEFDVDGRRYRLTRGNLSSGSTIWTEVTSWKELDSMVKWATGTACDGTADINIKFNPNGTADSGVICIQDENGTTMYTISVTSTSGRVRIDKS